MRLFVLLALAFARAAFGAEAPGAAAEGSLSLDGRTIPFHYAYVTEHGTLWVTLSASPLDRGQLKQIDFGHLPSEEAVFLEIHVNGQREATSISVRARSLADGLLNNDDVGVFSAKVASAERVEGSLTLPLPREIKGHRLSYSVRFRALPPASGPVRNLDDALDRVPSIRRPFARFNPSDAVLGIGVLGSFLLLVALALAWALFIAPRRARSLFRELEERGYAEMDRAAPELQSAIKSLAPLETEFSARLRNLDHIGRGREERFGFRKVDVPGLSTEFASLYAVYSRNGRDVAVSPRLQEALLDISRTFWPSSNSNTRFGPNGWGISASSAWLDRKALRILLDAADRISGAL